MTPDEHNRFALALSKLFLKCGRPPPTPYDREAFQEELDDLPIEAVEMGLREAARDALDGFLPTAGKVRHEAIEACKHLRDIERQRRPKLAARPYQHPTPEQIDELRKYRKAMNQLAERKELKP